LTSLDTAGLVGQLRSPNGWIRDKAQQMLLWQGENHELVATLKTSALEAPTPLGRLHALCTLEGLGKLDEAGDALIAALRHPEAGLRENALRLAESSRAPAVFETVLSLASDPDPKVQLQLAFGLGHSTEPAAGEVLAKLLNENPGDPYLAAAVLSSALPHLGPLSRSATPASRSSLLPMVLAAGDREALARLLAPAFEFDDTSPETTAPLRWSWFGEFLDDALARQISLDALQTAAPNDPLSRLLAQSDRLFTEATARLNDDAAPLPDRLAAAALLARDAPNRVASLAFLREQLQAGLHDESWPNILSTTAATGAPGLPDELLSVWPHLSPMQRGLSLDALLSRPAWTTALLEAFSAGTLRPAEIDATRRMRLLNHPDKNTKEKATAIFNLAASPGRSEVLARYQPALALSGDPEKGRLVYQKTCAACHQRGTEGLAVGPRLETVADHPAEKILTNIIDPNLDIQPGYHAYSATLKGGGQLFGLLAGESAASLTFKTLDAKTHAVRRDEIASLQSTGISLMPEGLEAAITIEEMADLIAFLRTK